MAEQATRLSAGSTAPLAGLPPQSGESARLSESAHPSEPAARYAALIGSAPRACSAPARRRCPRLPRGQRLLLAGAAATGIWLLTGLGHSTAAHAEVPLHPPAHPALAGSAAEPPSIRLLEQPSIRPLEHRLAGTKPLHPPQLVSSAGGRTVVPAIPVSAGLPTGLPLIGGPIQLPLPPLPVRVPLPVSLPSPIQLPAPVQLPAPIQLPVPVEGAPVPPVLSAVPHTSIAPKPRSAARPAPSVRFPELRAAWLIAAPLTPVRPDDNRPASERAVPPGPAPQPRPAPGRPALPGTGTPGRDGSIHLLPLGLLPSRSALDGSRTLAGRWAAEPAGPRARAGRPDVSPD